MNLKHTKLYGLLIFGKMDMNREKRRPPRKEAHDTAALAPRNNPAHKTKGRPRAGHTSAENVSPTILHVSRTCLYCSPRLHCTSLSPPLRSPARRLLLRHNPPTPSSPTLNPRHGHAGGAEPGPGEVRGAVVRDRVLPVHVPAQDGQQHARHLHAQPRRRHRQGPQRDVDRRPPRPHRGHRLARRPGQRRGQAQGPLLRAPLPPRLPRHRRLLGAPPRRRLPVRARRAALQEVPLDPVQAAAHGRGRVQRAGGAGQGGRVRRVQAPQDGAPRPDAGERGEPQGRRDVVDQVHLRRVVVWVLLAAAPTRRRDGRDGVRNQKKSGVTFTACTFSTVHQDHRVRLSSLLLRSANGETVFVWLVLQFELNLGLESWSGSVDAKFFNTCPMPGILYRILKL